MTVRIYLRIRTLQLSLVVILGNVNCILKAEHKIKIKSLIKEQLMLHGAAAHCYDLSVSFVISIFKSTQWCLRVRSL